MNIIKVYQNYIIRLFFYNLLSIVLVFLILGSIINIIEELKFFSGLNISNFIPLSLILLNLPQLIYQIFPFILLLSIMITLSELNDKDELLTFKSNGIDNFKILGLFSTISVFLGLFMVIFFYNFAAVAKYNYIGIKKEFTTDNKFLASITENGLWIKDQNETNIIFVNAKKIEDYYLLGVELTFLDKDFSYLKTIASPKVNIENNLWIIKDPKILTYDNRIENSKEIKLLTNFNSKKINNLYTNLSSLTFWQLKKLRDDYKSVNYSITDIEFQLQKIYTYPIYLLIIAFVSVTLMINIGKKKSKIRILTIGVFVSVIIYYVNNFFGVLGMNEKIPLLISVWFPLLTLLIMFSVGLVRINEK
jgi:lipopolysaccharide export system permease protein